MNEEQIRKAKELRSQGRSFLSIADEMKLPVKAVYMAIQGLEWTDYYNKDKQVAANKRLKERGKSLLITEARLGANFLESEGFITHAKAVTKLCDMYEKKRGK